MAAVYSRSFPWHVLFLLCAAARAWAAAPCLVGNEACLARVAVGAKDAYYYRSHALDAAVPEPGIRTAIVVVHGTLRNADQYFETMAGAVKLAGRERDTLVVAPHFKVDGDPLRDREARWTQGWKQGDRSDDEAAASSFEVVDRILSFLGERARFPRLSRVVVTGHSAGGQFTGRYAAGSRAQEGLRGIRVTYVVANPSSYLYLDGRRPVAGAIDRFAIPEKGPCPEYDGYHYGLTDRNEYMARVSDETLRRQLVSRHVVVFLGALDQGTELLDQSCPAKLQGPNRYRRGLAWFHYLKTFAPGDVELSVVPGADHSAQKMYQSREGLAILFARPDENARP